MDSRPRSFVLAMSGVVVIGVIAVAVAVGRANEANRSAPTGTSATAAPRPTATPLATLPFGDCSAVKFGDPLAPLGEPAAVHTYPAPPPETINPRKLYLVTITTAKGPFTICVEPALAPITANNIVTLARNHFYDGLLFHRIVPDFVVQGGDPTCTAATLAAADKQPAGCGAGGPGYTFRDEPVRQEYVEGAVAMANSGKNTNGSQFFICTADDRTKLTNSYNLFGKILSGMNVVKAIAKGDVMRTVTVAEER